MSLEDTLSRAYFLIGNQYVQHAGFRDIILKDKTKIKNVLSFAIPLKLCNGSRSVIHLIQAVSMSSVVPLTIESPMALSHRVKLFPLLQLETAGSLLAVERHRAWSS